VAHFIVLKDLAELATNVIRNARSHWKVTKDKLTVDNMLEHLRPLVPTTVQSIVEKNPEAPGAGKRDVEVMILFLDIAGTRESVKRRRESRSSPSWPCTIAD
jgi:hypothetical protein